MLLVHRILHFLAIFLLPVYCTELELESGITENGPPQPPLPPQEDTKVYCPAEVLENEKYGDMPFPQTPASKSGVSVKIPCPHGFRNDGFQPVLGQSIEISSKESWSGVIRTCYLNVSLEDGQPIGIWGEQPKIRYCKREGWEEDMTKYLNWVKSITPNSFSHLGIFTSMIWSYAAEDDYDCATALINGLAELLTSPSLTGEDGLPQRDMNRLFDMVESFTEMMSSRIPSGYKSQVGNLGIVVETANFKPNRFFSLKSQTNQTYFTQISPSGPEGHQPLITVDIPSEALQMAIDQSENDDGDDGDGPCQLTITAYSHDVFKQWSGDQMSSIDKGACLPVTTTNTTLGCEFSETGCQDQVPPYKTWGLLCIDLDGDIRDLKEPVEFLISSTEPSSSSLEGSQLKCVFWDEALHQWSSSGVTTTQLPDGGIKCTASHLTAFSALLEPLPLPFPGAEYAPINNSVHAYILSILSSVGSVLSIIGLGLTLFTYALFSSLRRERSNRILINLCLSLLLLHIMSLSGSRDLWDGHCFFPAVSLHYLVLTSLAWMMVEAVHMFDLLISVFVRPERRFLIKRLVLAWGIPLIIVGICAAVHPKVYQAGRADLCLMSAHENPYLYYGSYIIPICLMLLTNLVIFCRIFRVLYKQTKRQNISGGGMPNNKNGSNQAKLKFVKISPLQIKGATAVLVLLGIGWIFGLMAIGPFEVFFRYMYCVVNAGQGLFIFIFRVILNPLACKQWKKVMLGLSPDNSLDASFTTSSTAGDNIRRKQKSSGGPGNFISEANSVENSLTPSNPLSENLASALASILKSENERVKELPGGRY